MGGKLERQCLSDCRTELFHVEVPAEADPTGKIDKFYFDVFQKPSAN